MRALPLLLALLALAACQGAASDKELRSWVAKMEAQRAADPAQTVAPVARHGGPAVAPGGSGPARFALLLHEGFDRERAMEHARFVDGYWREPGNEGYQAVMEHLEAELRGLGFGADARRELRVIETEMDEPAWTPVAGRLVLRTASAERVLHAFDAPGDRERTMLPKGAGSAEVEGPVALSLEELVPGAVLVMEQAFGGGTLRAARERGAAAVLSFSLGTYNVDKSGQERHLDAIQYREVRAPGLPVGQISRRALDQIRAAKAADPAARLAFRAVVRSEQRALRTLVATLVGETVPEECVALAAHVQEPGACDNASGVASQLESLQVLVGLLETGRLTWPARSLSFVWGLEMEQSSILLERGGRKVFAAVASDMTGESRAATGALPLLERPPDPACERILPPDEHTEWGTPRPQTPSIEQASGIAIVARAALVDAGLAAGGWETREHPYEGGSDHTVFVGQGIPAVLFWHFTDFAYHTNLDRLEHVDPAEMRRMGTAALAAALALADPQAQDLDRYLRSLKLEQELRVEAARTAGDAALEQRWVEWLKAERMWLRRLCLGEKAAAAAR